MKYSITNLNIIKNPKGDILKFLSSKDDNFSNFGEIYFSQINYKSIKCWNCHSINNSKIIVVRGSVRFVFITEVNKFFHHDISADDKQIISIKNNCIFGFQGINDSKNTIMNLMDKPHDINEVIKYDKDEFLFDGWLS